MFTKTQQFLMIFGASMLCLGCQGAAVHSTDLVVEKKVENQEKPGDLLNIPEDCHLPKQSGRCFALFYRYGYDLDTQKCEQFVYGGCGGNKNNFETMEECEAKCLGKSIPANTENGEEVVSTTTVSYSTTNAPNNN